MIKQTRDIKFKVLYSSIGANTVIIHISIDYLEINNRMYVSAMFEHFGEKCYDKEFDYLTEERDKIKKLYPACGGKLYLVDVDDRADEVDFLGIVGRKIEDRDDIDEELRNQIITEINKALINYNL